MLLEIRVGREGHCTAVTFEGFVTSVTAHVYGQVGVLAERLGAEAAGEWSLAGVNHLVRLHVVLVAEDLVADVARVAGVRLLILVRTLHVLHHHAVRLERHVAVLAVAQARLVLVRVRHKVA